MGNGLMAENLTKDYPTRSGVLNVLDGVSLRLAPGESVAIVGPSGCGKSTLLNILGTLETPGGGRMTLDGVDPFALSEPELAKFRNRRIGFVFQDHHLLPHLSVLENVLVPTLVDGGGAASVERARRLLDRVGLTARLDHRPAELSGGERQRAAVARALVNQPLLILADEPTGNLDRRSAEAVADLLLELHRDERTILIVVTHSQSLAERVPQRFQLTDGRLESLS
ncbi:MAG TPA: ABC transporter ATP-binding protein [Phycisphaerae bacterium]|nr:ABC transporter ATP-binding protein [Phycisphaerae bacterium]